MKKEYAKKHHERALIELKKQQALDLAMEKELLTYKKSYKSIQGKYAKKADPEILAEFQRLKHHIFDLEALVKKIEEKNTQTAAYYDQQLQDTRRA